MDARLSQDAAEALAWHEFKESERARWKRVQEAQAPCTSTWAPVLTEQQKQEQAEYVKTNNLPF
jgi:hypothetical protein